MALPACLQPRLGLQVHGFIPPGCIGYLVDDDECEPILHEGEIAVVDITICEPEEGQLFLIEWNTGDRDIVETFRRPNRQADGTEAMRWWTGRYNRPRSREELKRQLGTGTVACIDGPYARTEYLAEKLIGKVVGVLAPDRHSRSELARRADVRHCPPHILATGYGRRPAGRIEPAGAASYRRSQEPTSRTLGLRQCRGPRG